MLTFPPDFSFVVQIVSFLVLWFGLKRLVFDPVLQVLEERTARTTGAHREAAEIAAATQVTQAQYERRIREERSTSFARVDAARRAAQDEERRIVSEAREHTSIELAQLRENLALQAAAERPALADSAREIAARIVERVVGRAIA